MEERPKYKFPHVTINLLENKVRKGAEGGEESPYRPRSEFRKEIASFCNPLSNLGGVETL